MSRKKKIIADLRSEITKSVQKTPDNKQAIEELSNLQSQAGWQRIVQVFDIKVEDFEKQILDGEVDGEELNRLRDRRDLCIYFRNLPSILITALGQGTTGEIPQLDPYEDTQPKEVDTNELAI